MMRCRIRNARPMVAFLALTLANALTGCVSSAHSPPAAASTPATPATPRLGAKPWDRGELAKRCMRFDGYLLELALDEHIYFSKEASSGGSGFAGGGCGCN